MGTVIGRVDELRPGEMKKFLLQCDGEEVEAFLLNYGGEHHAYVNRCRHVPMSLDWVENRFFDEDRRYVLCSTHGALFEPDSGECVSGPPFGKRLIRVPLETHGEEIWARTPDDFEDVL